MAVLNHPLFKLTFYLTRAWLLGGVQLVTNKVMCILAHACGARCTIITV